MKTNHIKTHILSILDEIIAYLCYKSHILKKLNEKKFHFTTSGQKNVKFEDFRQNIFLFLKATAKN